MGGDIRSSLGIPRILVARWAGVSVPTLTLFEANPMVVQPSTRARLVKVYAILKRTVDDLGNLALAPRGR
jgi:hypothetical protein